MMITYRRGETVGENEIQLSAIFPLRMWRKNTTRALTAGYSSLSSTSSNAFERDRVGGTLVVERAVHALFLLTGKNKPMYHTVSPAQVIWSGRLTYQL